MIRIESLSKEYGDIKAVKNISLVIKQGEITGFLGPNGAGKSSTLKIIAGYNKASSGRVYINEQNIEIEPENTKKLIGYLPELNPLYSEMTVFEYLKFVCEVRGIKGSEFNAKLKEIAGKCGIKERLNQQISTLSKGFKQRVGLAQAIIHDPPILILDEPTNGLDPNQIIEIRSLIRELGKNKTIILSSHILQEVQAICDRIIIIHQGSIAADAPKEELLKSVQKRQTISLEFTLVDITEDDLITHFPFITVKRFEKMEKSIVVVCETTSTKDIRFELSKYLNSLKATILGLKYEEKTLEEVFHNVTIGKLLNGEIEGIKQ
ncbi:MAG: ATP-binding cassette domain-containing protein [Candidatus Cloacimonetes bacterium]|nr:ATP-binding cassette domain-containing protein [Candidatus Cloacimonadota bacterium]MDD2650794.1 ATP-binding cassette domain-containing protein [Candidatus Cloacimonadota bacterium]